jgi:ribonuclease HIII
VRDSKAMSDRRIEELALEIRARCPNQVEILLPAEYNERYEKAGNLNRLLADLFATAIGKLVMETECNRVLVDRFARGNVLSHVLSLRLGELELEERPRAESDVAVAAASILAREAFVASIKDFRVKSGLDIPLGATNSDVVPVAKEIVKRWGAEGLRRSVKMHFKTTRKVL